MAFCLPMTAASLHIRKLFSVHMCQGCTNLVKVFIFILIAYV